VVTTAWYSAMSCSLWYHTGLEKFIQYSDIDALFSCVSDKYLTLSKKAINLFLLLDTRRTYRGCGIKTPDLPSKKWTKISLNESYFNYVRFLFFKGVLSRSMVAALSELCSLFLKGGNYTFIAAKASGLFPQTNIGHLNNYGPNGPNRKNTGSNC